MLSLSALADPTRRRIVELLAVEEYTAGEIVEEFDMSAPAISQHLKILREAKLIKVRAEGQRRVFSVNPAGFDELDAWLHRTKNHWATQRETLKKEPRAKPSAQPAREITPAKDDRAIIMMQTP
jgi:DNA-binding transcriptional ArsR family regulator